MEDSLQALESQLTEFFAPRTSNERKREIESNLENFSKQPGSWKQALYFVRTTKNQYVSMYCLSVIENAIKYTWNSMTSSEQNDVKTTLLSFLVQTERNSEPIPTFVRNKMVKVMVDIGKFSWPRKYPDFFNNVFRMLSNEETIMIGLLFLKTISEEWPSSKDEITSDRKVELKSLLLAEIPSVFLLFQNILSSGLQGDSDVNNSLICDNSHLAEVITLTLKTASHFLSWIPLDGVLTGVNDTTQQEGKHDLPFSPEFVRILCRYSFLGTCYNNQRCIDISIAAMGALNEILYRKFIPKEFDEHLDLLLLYSVEVLDKLLKKTHSSESSLSSALGTPYVEKALELVSLVSNSAFVRYGWKSVENFIELLLNFTFSVKESAFYYELIEIWSKILGNLNAQLSFINLDEKFEKLKDILIQLARGVVESTVKFNVTANGDCFDADDEEESDISNLLRNIDILVKIGELLPTESLESMASTWQECCKFFVDLQFKMDLTKTNINVESTLSVEHFTFVVQLIGRMANVLYDEAFKEELELGKTLFSQLIWLLSWSESYYFVHKPECLVKANCEIVYAAKTWMYWLARYNSEIVLVDINESDSKEFTQLLKKMKNTIFFVIENCAALNTTLVLANLTLFTTLTNCVRTKELYEIFGPEELVSRCEALRTSMSPECFRLLNKGISSLLLLPWQASDVQNWEQRTTLYSQYMQNRLQCIYQCANRPQFLILYIQILNDQLELLKMEPTISRKICWLVLREGVPFLQNLLTTYLNQSAISSELMTFFLRIMEVLRQQCGAQFFEQCIQGLLNLFSSQNIINELLQETESSFIVIDKFIQMLTYMVKDSSPFLKKLLPDALAVIFDHIYPILSQRVSPDLKLPYFKFVRDCLAFRWSYFFPHLAPLISSKLSLSSPCNSEDSKTKQEEQLSLQKSSQRLDQILTSIGHSFLQSDLEVFRYNLNTLTYWNEKHHIYSKLCARAEVINQFMVVLLQVLAQRSHEPLKEDIALVLHGMANVNFARFCQEFLPSVLRNQFPLLQEQQRDSLSQIFAIHMGPRGVCDLPTFSQCLARFIDDLRYLHYSIECEMTRRSSSL